MIIDGEEMPTLEQACESYSTYTSAANIRKSHIIKKPVAVEMELTNHQLIEMAEIMFPGAKGLNQLFGLANVALDELYSDDLKKNRIIYLHNTLVKFCPVGLHLSSLRDTNDMVDKQVFKHIAECGLKFCKICPSSHLHERQLKPFLIEYINLVEGK